MKNIILITLILNFFSVSAQETIPDLGSEYQGGIIVYKNNNHGLIIAKQDAPKDMIWEMAKYYCENLEIDGYKDWRLPNNFEWIQIYKFWKASKRGNLDELNVWWSLTDGGRQFGKLTAYIQYFTDGSQEKCGDRESDKYSVRAIRSF